MRATTVACLGLMVALCRPVAAQDDVELAMRFFHDGGAYCFRVVPEGIALSEETAWTVMLLTGGSNRNNTARIRTVEPGPTRLAGQALEAVGAAVTGVWRAEGEREEFFRRFAAGIEAKTLRARVVTIAPARLAQMTPGERADLYLDFADKGTRVAFDKVRDLSADVFLTYETYMPD